MQEKIKGLIGFAIRGKKYSIGESVLFRKNKVKIALLAIDCAPSTKKKYLDKLSYNSIPYVEYGTKNQLGELLHKDEISLLAIEDINLAKEIIKLIKEEN
jgi:ribosomal protein L7Ae-like RNA K-turn-binding protein